LLKIMDQYMEENNIHTITKEKLKEITNLEESDFKRSLARLKDGGYINYIFDHIEGNTKAIVKIGIANKGYERLQLLYLSKQVPIQNINYSIHQGPGSVATQGDIFGTQNNTVNYNDLDKIVPILTIMLEEIDKLAMKQKDEEDLKQMMKDTIEEIQKAKPDQPKILNKLVDIARAITFGANVATVGAFLLQLAPFLMN
jgi:hypothetical protein